MDASKTRYARNTDGTSFAYQVVRSGPDLLVAWPCISSLEFPWEDQDVGTWLRSLARFAERADPSGREGLTDDESTAFDRPIETTCGYADDSGPLLLPDRWHLYRVVG